jgi:hypothetical protein
MRRAVSVLLLAIACTQQPSLPSPTPMAEPSRTIAASAAPSRTVAGIPVSTSSPTNRPFGIVQAFPLGPLRGDWVFALRETQTDVSGVVRVELLCMPLGESTARVAATYLQPAGGVDPVLPNGIASQLSPDGRRIVLGVPGGTRFGELVLVDLEQGSVRSLGQGILPVWGSSDRIAFLRQHPTDFRGAATSWIMEPASGAVTQIPDDATPLVWHRDTLVVSVSGGIELRVPADARTGLSFPMALDTVPLGERAASALPQSGVTVVAVPTFDGGESPGTHRIEVISTPGAGSRETVASEFGTYSEVRFAEPRWNPHPDVRQILYRRGGTRRYEVQIVDLRTGRDVTATVTGIARRAEWTPDGEQIVYITDQRGLGYPGTEVRSIRPISGRDDRLLMTIVPGSIARFRDVATFRYAP